MPKLFPHSKLHIHHVASRRYINLPAFYVQKKHLKFLLAGGREERGIIECHLDIINDYALSLRLPLTFTVCGTPFRVIKMMGKT